MSILRSLILAALPVTIAVGAARAEVEVWFHQPERFTDAGMYRERGARVAEPTLEALRAHFQALGERHLAPGQALRVEVRDVDLAGRYEPWRIDTRDVRVMRDITWPRIALRWRLEEQGVVTAEAEETIRDLHYLSRDGLRGRAEPLAYEKAMLEDWFRLRIVEGRPVAERARAGAQPAGLF